MFKNKLKSNREIIGSNKNLFARKLGYKNFLILFVPNGISLQTTIVPNEVLLRIGAGVKHQCCEKRRHVFSMFHAGIGANFAKRNFFHLRNNALSCSGECEERMKHHIYVKELCNTYA